MDKDRIPAGQVEDAFAGTSSARGAETRNPEKPSPKSIADWQLIGS